MPSKSQTQLIRSLNQKKYRNLHQLFVVEGEKSVQEFLHSHWQLQFAYTTQDPFAEENSQFELVSQKQMQALSMLKTAPGVLAVFQIPATHTPKKIKGINLVLDQVSDPGNLGTIIRLADWFGVENIYCSQDTVDAYNPKTVQASMGSLSRKQPIYTDLEALLQNSKIDVYGTFLNGENMYNTQFPDDLFLVLGSESHGISEAIASLCTQQITIPRAVDSQAESLNVTVAAAVIVGQLFSARQN